MSQPDHEEGPAPKRARLGEAAAAAPTAVHAPRLRSLVQVSAGLPREPSPGAMHGCRVAAWAAAADGSSVGAVLASGRDVYATTLQQQQQLQQQQEALQLQPEEGKVGVLLPLRQQAPPAALLPLPRHAGEVQSLALCSAGSTGEQPGELLLATADAYGCGSVSRLRASGSGLQLASSGARLVPPGGCLEGGWAGVAFSGGGASSGSSAASAGAEPVLLAVARGFVRDVSVFDVATGSVVRSFGCQMTPHALGFLPAASALGGGGADLLAVAEGHSVCLFDARAGGCVQRLTPGSIGQPLYALAWCEAQGGLLGAAGAERSLFLAEPRKWRCVSKWNGATRLAIHSLAFLDADPRCAVVAGLDLEVMAGRWDRPAGGAAAAARPFTSAPLPDGEDSAAGRPAPAPAAAAPGAPGSGDRSRGAGGAADAAAGEGGSVCFRGDGRFLGVSKAGCSDVLACYAASGNLVFARF